jgi:hypothetical protein
MVQRVPQIGYAVVVTGTLLSMSLQYQGFLESDMMPDKIYQSKHAAQGFVDEWNGIVIGESKIDAKQGEQIKQINLPDFRKKYKVKMRVRDAGRLQPPRFSDPENA